MLRSLRASRSQAWPGAALSSAGAHATAPKANRWRVPQLQPLNWPTSLQERWPSG